MNSTSPAPQRTVGLLKKPLTQASVTLARQDHDGNAANDDAVTTVDFFQNPLWSMAIALGVFCAVAALVMAFD
jgi:hypothetical protein